MKLITLPLAVMVLLSIFSMLGMGTSYGNLNLQYGDTSQLYYYDYYGHAVSYANLTAVGEAGVFTTKNAGFDSFTGQWVQEQAAWVNDTSVQPIEFKISYPVYYDTAHQHPVKFSELGSASPNNQTLQSGSLGSSLGFIVLIVGIMALAGVVGLRILGSGLSETSASAIVKGVAFLAVWGVFSALAYPLLLGTGFFLFYIVYFALTCIYTLGIINQIGSPGED